MTRGTQHQPKALHLGSFSVCFRSSVDKAAAPADNPATETILGFSLAVMSLKYQRQLVCQGPSWVAKCKLLIRDLGSLEVYRLRYLYFHLIYAHN